MSIKRAPPASEFIDINKDGATSMCIYRYQYRGRHRYVYLLISMKMAPPVSVFIDINKEGATGMCIY